ncbi:MAG: hypothetical protein EPO25_11465 [Gammaproteobacteria bacterium]|nr:MAG: hypothetical protein EPO25_11465 [Gammaproteobacteria bacterium]
MSAETRRDFLAIAAALSLTPAVFLQACARLAQPGDVEADDAALLAACQRLLPLVDAPAEPFLEAVRQLDALAARDPQAAQAIAAGIAALRRGRPGAAPAGDFLALLIATAIPVLVNHPEIWRVAGYEGESYSRGGYLLRGFNDLAWLPEPPADSMGAVPSGTATGAD